MHIKCVTLVQLSKKNPLNAYDDISSEVNQHKNFGLSRPLLPYFVHGYNCP